VQPGVLAGLADGDVVAVHGPDGQFEVFGQCGDEGGRVGRLPVEESAAAGR